MSKFNQHGKFWSAEHDAIEQLIEEYQRFIEQYFRTRLTVWKDHYIEKMEAFVEVLRPLAAQRESLLENAHPLPAIWQEIEKAYQQYLTWAAADQEKYLRKDIHKTFLRDFERDLVSRPALIHVQIPKTYWDERPHDSQGVKLWKTLRKPLHTIQRPFDFLRRTVVNLISSDAPLPPGPTRSVYLHNFLTFYLGFPVARQLHDEWLRYLKHIAQAFYDFQSKTEVIKDQFLFLNQFGEMVAGENNQAIVEAFDHLEQHMRDIDGFRERIDAFEKETIARFNRELRKDLNALRHQWEYAGTILLTNQDFGKMKRHRVRREMDKECSGQMTAWREYLRNNRIEWGKNLELDVLGLQSAGIVFDIMSVLSQKITAQVIPAFEEAKGLVVDALNAFEKRDEDDVSSMKTEIHKQNRSTLRILREQLLPQMLDTIINAKLENTLKSAVPRIEEFIDKLSDKHTVFQFRDLEGLKPRFNTQVISLKELVRKEGFTPFKLEYEKACKEIHQDIEHTTRDISEIDEIVEFNLEAALTVLRSDSENALEKARQEAINGLTRASAQTDAMIEKTENLVRVTGTALLDNVLNFLFKIEELIDSEKIIELNLRLMAANTREDFRNFWVRLLEGSTYAVKNTWRLVKEGRELWNRAYHRVTSTLGLSTDIEKVEESLIHFLAVSKNRIAALPFVYQRLFELKPLEDDRFLVGRERELSQIEREFAAWKNGHFTFTAIIGENGSGRATLLNFAEKSIFKNYDVCRFDVNNQTIYEVESLLEILNKTFVKALHNQSFESLEELEEALNAQEKGVVCILKDLQRLFIRTVDGFDCMERFLLFISRTASKVHWVISCTQYSWTYLSRVVDVQNFTRQVVEMDNWNAEQIEEIILRRHRLSGYHLHFTVPASVRSSRKFKKLNSEEERQTYLRKYFFSQLAQLSAGNITAAILFWLRSIKEVSDEQFMVPAKINFDASFLEQLSGEELFTLAAFVQHDQLIASHHAMIFHQDIQESRLILTLMMNKGFLTFEDDHYHIDPILYRPILRNLREQNIVS